MSEESKTNEQLKALVNPEVYDIVDKATDHYIRAGKIQERYIKLEEVQEQLKKHTINQWNLRLEVNHMTKIAFDHEGVLAPLVWETIIQLLSLLEAIHYSERKDAIIKFNNSLKSISDGKNAKE